MNTRFASILVILLLTDSAYAQFKAGFTVDAKVEGSLSSATKRQFKVTPTVSLFYVPKGAASTRTRIEFSTLYDQTKSDTSPLNITRRHVGEAEEMWAFASGKRFLATKGEWDHNNALGMRLQQSYGAGGGVTLFEKKNAADMVVHRLSAAADVRYFDQDFIKQPRQRFTAAVFGERLFQKVGPLSITQSFFFTAPFRETSSWQFRTVTAINVPVWKGLGFGVTGNDDYIRNAPRPFRRNFYTVATGITFTH